MNALLFEIAYHRDSHALLRRLLTRVQFALGSGLPAEFTVATILLEQSLSDFGDADAILLLEHGDAPAIVFLEAKVKSSGREVWQLQREFADFESGVSSRVNSSNLFAQLYSKVRFACAAKRGGLAELCAGVKFPPCSSKQLRKLGSNEVVLRAVQTILPYLVNPYFIGLVPEEASRTANFVRDKLAPTAPQDFDEWDVTSWGFLSWHDVADFCRAETLAKTLEVLEFNRGQIY